MTAVLSAGIPRSKHCNAWLSWLGLWPSGVMNCVSLCLTVGTDMIHMALQSSGTWQLMFSNLWVVFFFLTPLPIPLSLSWNSKYFNGFLKYCAYIHMTAAHFCVRLSHSGLCLAERIISIKITSSSTPVWHVQLTLCVETIGYLTPWICSQGYQIQRGYFVCILSFTFNHLTNANSWRPDDTKFLSIFKHLQRSSISEPKINF